jgi:hypothetical protein
MTHTEWLRRQVARLENEIRSNLVFEENSPATTEELTQLRQTIVLHTYLRQQLLRRERVKVASSTEECVAADQTAYIGR